MRFKRKYLYGGKTIKYPNGGKYSNSKGVVMGPVENPDGTYTVPQNSQGEPVVNLPEFNVYASNENSNHNKYSPTSAKDFLENIGYLGLDLLGVGGQEYTPQENPFNPGEYLPASGRIDNSGHDIGLGVISNVIKNPLKTGIKESGEYLTTQTPLRNTRKLNPFAENLNNPNSSYRVAGLDAAEDFQNSGVLRSRNTSPPIVHESGFVIPARPTSFPSFQKGYADMTYLPQEGGVVFKTDLPTFKRGDINPVSGKPIKSRHYAHRVIDPKTGNTMTEIPASEIKMFEGKPHWLKGYKEIPKNKYKYGGTMKKIKNKYAAGGELNMISNVTSQLANPIEDVLASNLNMDSQFLEKEKSNPLKYLGAAGAMIGAIGARKRESEFLKDKNKMYQNNVNEIDGNISFEDGGSMLNTFEGNTHEESNLIGETGIKYAGNEVQDGETEFDNVIFSNDLKPKNKKSTFAAISKRIRDKYLKFRPGDPPSEEIAKDKLRDLAREQEYLAQKQGLRGGPNQPPAMLKYGGRVKYEPGGWMGGSKYKFAGTPGGFSDYEKNWKPSVDPIFQNKTLDGSTSGGAGSEGGNFGGVDWMDAVGLASNMVAPLYNLNQNKNIDPVNYQRAKPNLVDTYKANVLAGDEINESLNAADYSIRQSTPSGQSRMGNLRALGIKGSKIKGKTAADIQQKADLTNVDILNNMEQFNTQIGIKETEDYARNKGQVLNNRSQAVSDLGRNISGSMKDLKSYQAQVDMIENFLGTNDLEVVNGKIKFKKK